jgi:hypothetical protein
VAIPRRVNAGVLWKSLLKNEHERVLKLKRGDGESQKLTAQIQATWWSNLEKEDCPHSLRIWASIFHSWYLLFINLICVKFVFCLSLISIEVHLISNEKYIKVSPLSLQNTA